MSRCRTRRSMSPMETSPSTSGPRRLPETTSRLRSLPRSVATSTSRRAGETGFDEIIVRVGPGKGRKVRFVGILLGEWLNTSSSSRRNLPRLPRPDGQVRPPHRTQPRLHGGRRARASRQAGAATSASATSVTGPRPASRPSRSSKRSRSFANGSRRSSSTWSPAQPSGHPLRTSTSDPRPLDAGRGEVRHDGDRNPVGDPRHRSAQVVRSAARPRRHRSRGRRRHGLRPPRAEWRRQDDRGPDPLDLDPRRWGRGPGRRPRCRP